MIRRAIERAASHRQAPVLVCLIWLRRGSADCEFGCGGFFGADCWFGSGAALPPEPVAALFGLAAH